jgi:hypothetical protein
MQKYNVKFPPPFLSKILYFFNFSLQFHKNFHSSTIYLREYDIEYTKNFVTCYVTCSKDTSIPPVFCRLGTSGLWGRVVL